MMPRVTMRMPIDDLEELEALVEDGHFVNRSEAIRQAVRDLVDEHDDVPRPAPTGIAATDGGRSR